MSDIDRPLPLAPLRFPARGCAPRRAPAKASPPCAAPAHVGRGDEVVPTELWLPDGCCDTCVSFYVFNHVPRERLAGLLAKIHRWLVPGGWFMHAFGQSDLPAWTGTWIDDAPVFCSSYPAELVTFREPEGEATFQWILARS